LDGEEGRETVEIGVDKGGRHDGRGFQLRCDTALRIAPSIMRYSIAAASPIANSPATTVNVEWNPDQVFADLTAAIDVLTDRCLHRSAQWSAEQLVGLDCDGTNVSAASDIERTPRETNPNAIYARSLVNNGEFAHAAAVLSEPNGEPAPDLSPYAFYLRAYAFYMDGERRKEESKDKKKKNPHLAQLLRELGGQRDKLDAFGLHVYGMVLKESPCMSVNHPEAHQVLVQSILLFPYNWSAWLDLADVTTQEVELVLDQDLGQPLASHFAFHAFCAHLQASHGSYQEALDMYSHWTGLLATSPYWVTQSAVAHYHLRQFSSAQSLLHSLHTNMPCRLEAMDVYSNILYVQNDSVGLAALAHQAVRVDPYRAETCCIVGNYYSHKQERAQAIRYFQRALRIDRTFSSAWTLMGHEYVEWKQTSSAMESYRQACQVNPQDYRAWYGLGQTYELLEMNLYALYYYKQATTLRPDDARMWTAVGNSYALLKRTSQAIEAYERALQQDDTEGVATHKLASLYEKNGEKRKAADCYMQHLKNRYHTTRPSGKPAVANDTDLLAILPDIFIEAPEAEAMMFLARYYREKRDFDRAGLLCNRLQDYPGPEKDQATALMREIRNLAAAASQTPKPTTPPDNQSRFMFSP